MSKHLEKRSLRLAGHRTSVALEPEFWRAVEGMASAQQKSIPTLIAEIDAERASVCPEQPLSSAVRCQALSDARGID